MNPRSVVLVVASLVAGALLTACGGTPSDETETPSRATQSSTPSESATPSATPTQATGTRLEVTIRGNDITPDAEQVPVKRGEQITLEITADRAGELHVHSTPEQVVDFASGRTTARLSFDRPGLVEVEEHDSGKLVVQLAVR